MNSSHANVRLRELPMGSPYMFSRVPAPPPVSTVLMPMTQPMSYQTWTSFMCSLGSRLESSNHEPQFPSPNILLVPLTEAQEAAGQQQQQQHMHVWHGLQACMLLTHTLAVHILRILRTGSCLKPPIMLCGSKTTLAPCYWCSMRRLLQPQTLHDANLNGSICWSF